MKRSIPARIPADIGKRAILFINTHAKYIILIGIYLTCLLLSAVYDPYARTWFNMDFKTGEMSEVTVNAEEMFYRETFNRGGLNTVGLSFFKQIGARILTLGTADIINVFDWIGSHDRKEITMVVFPVLAAVKFFLMKKFFSRKKDPLKRSWKDILYYRSENFFFDIAADTVMFFMAGIIINLADSFCDSVVAAHGYAFKGASDVLLAVLLIPCFIPYKVTEWLVSVYQEFIIYDIPDHRDTLSGLLLYLFCILLASAVFLLLFELSMRIMMKPFGVLFGHIRLRRRQKRKQQAQNADTQQPSGQTDGTHIYQNKEVKTHENT